MSRMNGHKRKKIYEYLVHRDGEYCFIGGEPGTKANLVVDHANNNNADNRESNLHLFCRSMNSTKNPRGLSNRKQSPACTSVRGDTSGPEPVQVSAELKKNQQAEPDFRHWVFIEIWRKGKLPISEVINCGAAIARCSQSAVRRYLDKECSRVRIYQIVEDPETKERFVRFRPFWERCRRLEEKRLKLVQKARDLIKEQNQKLNDKRRARGAKKVNENDGGTSAETSQNSQRPP